MIQIQLLIYFLIFLTFIVILKLFLPHSSMKIKLISYNLCLIVQSMLTIPLMLLRPKHFKNTRLPFFLNRMFARYFLNITMEVRGIENLNEKKGNVVILNHQSSFDITALSYFWPKMGPAKVVCKKEILYTPFFGIACWLSGFIFINRSNRSSSVQALNEQINAIENRNFKIVLYPEGTRNKTEDLKLLPFKKGAFQLALKAKCSIQPILISNWKIVKNRGIVKILPEIETDKYDNDNIEELIKICYDTMQTELNKINKEIESMTP